MCSQTGSVGPDVVLIAIDLVVDETCELFCHADAY